MRLREIQKQCPDRFRYRGKFFYMTHYSIEATHYKKRSDHIVWETEDKMYCITYEKGYIYAENEKGEVFAEVEK